MICSNLNSADSASTHMPRLVKHLDSLWGPYRIRIRISCWSCTRLWFDPILNTAYQFGHHIMRRDKILLERVQHRFTRLIPGFKQLTYVERLRRLRLWTLEESRNRADLLEVLRIFRGQSWISFTDLFTISTMTNTRGHAAKLTKHRCRLDLRRYFSERVVDRWNSLPQDSIDAHSLNTFKNGLDRVRSLKMGFFMD